MYRVFLADDEAWERKAMKKIIQEMELPLLVDGEAEDGIEAWNRLREKNPDILLADIRMPGLTGLELVQQMRGEGMDTKVIFISGYAEFDYARKALKMGASDYLLKPVEEEDLKEILEELILELDGTKAYGEVENVSFGIEEILLEIQKDCCEDITLKGLAEKYYISDSRLSVLLKERLGMSFPNYLASIRIKKAQGLMKDERLSLEAIAKMVGFKDYFYFSKVFKKTAGISPGRFRKKIK